MPTEPQLPSYDAPPVIEFVAGVQFEDISGFQTGHFGRFWSEIAADYPTTEDQQPLLSAGFLLGKAGLLLPPLRRAFFISADENYVIQLQNNRIHLNWRKMKDADVYPRFETLFKRFDEVWRKFGSFALAARLPAVVPTRYELTYLNHIEVADKDFSTFVEESIRTFNWSAVKPKFLPNPKSLGLELHFEFPDRGTLSASLTHARRKENGPELLVLNMTASGPASARDSMIDWFQDGHAWIVRGFTDLTTESAHLRWRRTL